MLVARRPLNLSEMFTHPVTFVFNPYSGLGSGPSSLYSCYKIFVWLQSLYYSILTFYSRMLVNLFLLSLTSLHSYSPMTAVSMHSTSLSHWHTPLKPQYNYPFLIPQTRLESSHNTLSFMSEDLSQLVVYCLFPFKLKR